jgi:hypothetical protein
MNCQHIQTLLGRLHDGELEPVERGAIEVHLRSCGACQSELAALRELSDLTAALSEPEPPGDLWDRVAGDLAKVQPGRPGRVPTWLRSGWAAAAALVFVAGIAGWWAYQINNPRGTSAVAVNNDDDLLLDDLLAIRSRQPMSLQEASKHVNFQLLSAADLPDGCRLEQCSLCKCDSGCCDMVQCRFRCRGQPMLLVQGNPDHALRYGNRPTLTTQINGQPARVVQCEGCLACSWQNNDTAITLVGPRDLAQLVQIVTHVDQRFGDKR